MKEQETKAFAIPDFEQRRKNFDEEFTKLAEKYQVIPYAANQVNPQTLEVVTVIKLADATQLKK